MFNALQNYGSSHRPVIFYVFDVMVLRGKDVTSQPLERRQVLLQSKALPKLKEALRYAGVLDAPLADKPGCPPAARADGLPAWHPVGGFIKDRAAYFTFFIQFRIGSVTVLSAVSGENTSDMWLCPLT